MRNRANQILVCGFVAVLLANVAAPGLLLHNCRQFGTRSTELCACCEAELESSGGCCSMKSGTAAKIAHPETAIGSECCFTSIEAPFSFDGHGGLQSAPLGLHADQSLIASFDGTDRPNTTYSFCNTDFPDRHSSDPPSYILTHSFRC